MYKFLYKGKPELVLNAVCKPAPWPSLARAVAALLGRSAPLAPFGSQEIIDTVVEKHVRATGADNFSRVVTELERAGCVARYYEGYRTNHANRGGLRNLVCVLDADVSAALRRRDMLV